jgi:PTS system fructose-specific IIC component
VAYVFAVGMLPELLFSPMAAVMVAGMVPPLGFGVAHLLMPSRFPDVDRQQARAALIAGCSFVTEGALVYTANTPGRFDLSCVLGAATAGAAAMYLGVSVPAPHGGILVIPLTNGPGAFVAALVVGVAVTAAASVVRKPTPQSRPVTDDG